MAHDENSIDLGTPKQRAVLAVLAVEAGRPVQVDSLIDRVWSDDPPRRVHNSLHAYITRLRRGIEDTGFAAGTEILSYHSGSYRLAVDPCLVDLHLARGLVAEAGTAAAAGADEDAAALLRRSLRLWVSQPLAGMDGDWAAWTRSALVRERIGAIIQCSDVELRLGRHLQLLSELPRLAAEHPTEEQLVARTILTLYRCGFRDEALRTYRRLRESLVAELGIEPSRDLQQLQQSILKGDAGPAPEPQWGTRGHHRHPHAAQTATPGWRARRPGERARATHRVPRPRQPPT